MKSALLGKRPNNILLVESGAVSLLVWEDGCLTQRARYRPVDPDYAAFTKFLREHRKVPFIVVADCIEEDFRNEMVAHVTGADRKALLTRKMNHAFRNTVYRTARIVGREREGRKDDKALFTALTKPELVDPWLSRILDMKIPIKTLTSAAYVMELFAESLKIAKEDHLLLVNQEPGTGLRQTYLQKGRVIFSRLTAIGSSDGTTFEEMLLGQCEQTRKYLERIKQLPYDILLNVRVYTPEPMTESHERQQELLRFSYFAVNELKPLEIDLQGEAPGVIAYTLALSLAHKGVPNIYAPMQTRRYLYISHVTQALYTATAMALVATLGVSAPGLLAIFNNWETEGNITFKTQPLLREYEVLRERFPETPIPSNKMELIVSTHDNILRQVFWIPDTLQQISIALAASPFLSLARIEWELVEVPLSEEEQAQFAGLVEPDEVIFQRAVLSSRTTLVTTLEGRVQSNASHREAREQVLTFTKALDDLPELTVMPVVLPMDPGESGAVATTLDGELVRAEFTLELRQEVAPEVLPEVAQAAEQEVQP